MNPKLLPNTRSQAASLLGCITMTALLRSFAPVMIVLALQFTPAIGQDVKFERERQSHILEVIRDDIKKYYFDPDLKGIDIDAKYKAAKEKIENAPNVGQMSAIIAAFLLDFDDSHLFYEPPGHSDKVEYGFTFYMVGDKCFVNKVAPGSSAQKVGLTPGDELLSIEGFRPDRGNVWKMQYAYYTLRPRTGLTLEVRKPDRTETKLDIAAKITKGRRVMDLTGDSGTLDLDENRRRVEDSYERATRQFVFDKFPDVYVWKMPEWALDPANVDSIFSHARKYPALVLDLRGNPGGRIDMLLRALGNLFAD